MSERVFVKGIAFHNVTLEEAVEFAMDRMRRGERCIVFTPNAEIVHACSRDEELRRRLNEADLILPDGIGVVYAAKILGTPLKERVAGIDFAAALTEAMAKEGFSLFLLGAKPGIAEKAARNLKERTPELDVCGVKDGYFADDEEAVQAVLQAGPAALFACLGFPKQEKFLLDYLEETGACVAAGLGGSLDVFAGEVQRAPDVFIRLGLEWFYRLLKQPSRIGRIAKLPVFMGSVLFDKLRGAK